MSVKLILRNVKNTRLLGRSNAIYAYRSDNLPENVCNNNNILEITSKTVTKEALNTPRIIYKKQRNIETAYILPIPFI